MQIGHRLIFSFWWIWQRGERQKDYLEGIIWRDGQATRVTEHSYYWSSMAWSFCRRSSPVLLKVECAQEMVRHIIRWDKCPQRVKGFHSSNGIQIYAKDIGFQAVISIMWKSVKHIFCWVPLTGTARISFLWKYFVT